VDVASPRLHSAPPPPPGPGSFASSPFTRALTAHARVWASAAASATEDAEQHASHMLRAARGIARQLVAVSGGAAVERRSQPTLQQLREVRVRLRSPARPSYAIPAALSSLRVESGDAVGALTRSLSERLNEW
jgi:hypothetical protein